MIKLYNVPVVLNIFRRNARWQIDAFEEENCNNCLEKLAKPLLLLEIHTSPLDISGLLVT